MKTLALARFIFSGAASFAAFAAQITKDSGPEFIGRFSAEPDVVLEWNAAISDHFEEFSLATTSHIQARVYAMVHLAMRDAIAAAKREARHDADGAIAKSAASAAAHDILVALRPAGANRFASLHARHLGAIANDSSASHGGKIGQRIAVSILTSRANDGWPVALSQSTAEIGRDSRRRMVAKPAPFVLKRAQQFAPESPVIINIDGVVLANRGLWNKKYIGTPSDITLATATAELWRTETVARWNRAAHSLAVQLPQDLHVRARMFASLNTALSDALLSATYWSDAYRNGRMGGSVLMAVDAYHRAIDSGETLPSPAELTWVSKAVCGFPAIPAVLAGAAEVILRACFGGEAVLAPPTQDHDTAAPNTFTSLRSAARQCAWAEFVSGASTPEGCVAGYDLGSRIAGHVLKQDPR